MILSAAAVAASLFAAASAWGISGAVGHSLAGGDVAATDPLAVAALRCAPHDMNMSASASAASVDGADFANDAAKSRTVLRLGDPDCFFQPTAFDVSVAAGDFVEPAEPLRFMWRVGVNNASSACRGVMPSSYQIIVRCGEDYGRVVWDTGLAPYAGNSAIVPCNMYPDEACSAEFAIWPTSSLESRTIRFRTALRSGQRPRTPGDSVSASAWEGFWIAGGTQLRGEFHLPLSAGVGVASAVAYASGVGCFSLSVNGRPLVGSFDGQVGDSFLDPGFSTVFSDRLLYRAFDLSGSWLVDGLNVFGVRLGMCKFGYLTQYCPGATAWTPTCRAFLLQVNMRLSNGAQVNFTSSPFTGDWHATTEGNPIYYTHMFHGEMFNASREQVGWDRPGGPSPEAPLWQPAVPYAFPTPLGALSLMTIPPIRIKERRSAVSVYSVAGSATGGWVWVWDFGQNWAGFAVLKVQGLASGVRLVLRYAEVVDANGLPFNTYCPGWCAAPPWASQTTGNVANQTDVFITSGRAEETFVPSFTYHGYRYVSVEGLPDGYVPQSDMLTSLFLHTDLPTNGNIYFPDEGASLLNRIQTAVLYTQASNMHSIPTDCPQREKRGWMGDAQWTSAQASLNFVTSEFYRNFVRSFEDTQDVGCYRTSAVSPPFRLACYQCCSKAQPSFGCDWTGVTDDFVDDQGSLPDVVPYPGKPYGGWPGDPTWGSAAAEIPYENWKMSGDGIALVEAYPQAKAFVDFLTRHMDSATGLVQFGYYGDWCSTVYTPVPSVSAYSHILAVRRMEAMARALNLASDAEEYAQLQEQLKGAWHRAYYRPATKSYAGGQQTGNAMALVLDVAPTLAIRRAVAASIAQGIRKGPTTGGVGFRAIFEALMLGGEIGAAIDLALRTEAPSIGNMLETGPGTIWEVWTYSNGFSWNHPMFAGGIGLFLYHIAGLALESSHEEPVLRVYAQAAERLRRATGSIIVAGGLLRWSWRLEAGSLYMLVSVPVGGPGVRVEVPRLAGAKRLTESGQELWPKGVSIVPGVRDVHLVREPDVAISLYLSGGEYDFVLVGR